MKSNVFHLQDRKGWFPALLISIVILAVTACNSSGDKKGTTVDTSVSTTDTGAVTTTETGTTEQAAIAPAANINFPIFKIDRTDLAIPHGKKPSKIIIKFKFTNFANPLGSMTLLLYSAKSHTEHATNDDPKEISDKSEGTKSIPRGFILGNSEFDYSVILTGGSLSFSYLILTPALFRDAQGMDHLVFNITSYDAANTPTKLGATAFTNYDTKPSPPAPPEP